MFILEVLLGLKSKQGDVTCAFLQANLEPDETVYVYMPLGFNIKSKNGKRHVLKLNKTLYGLRQSLSQGFLEVYYQEAGELQVETI